MSGRFVALVAPAALAVGALILAAGPALAQRGGHGGGHGGGFRGGFGGGFRHDSRGGGFRREFHEGFRGDVFRGGFFPAYYGAFSPGFSSAFFPVSCGDWRFFGEARRPVCRW
jgi:hypothetical protein